MHVSFDLRKDAANRRKHGVSLSRAASFNLGTALTLAEDSQDYGEVRYRSIGFLGERLYVLIFTETESGIRAISLRKAQPSEEYDYAEAIPE